MTTTPSRRRSPSAVETRSMNAPLPGWTLEQALDMLDQGYRLERVAELSGYASAYLAVQSRKEARGRTSR